MNNQSVLFRYVFPLMEDVPEQHFLYGVYTIGT